ncbi:uncharacterized protein LOC122252446 [Penaeus japonicus]|uniref:uncharacterized protein LOC122252446 n=1 Tax=Penaeus japonicus TaxID=27405 RepID=UPI001C70CDFC|nr:uncharacterized protein LOC122252446 [Penaeus japonicus]
MATVKWRELWCQCQGNASAVPHQVLISQQMTRLHLEAQRHVLWYVGAVLVMYILGLALIICKSGRSERQTATSALLFCCSSLASLMKRRGSRDERAARAARAAQEASEEDDDDGGYQMSFSRRPSPHQPLMAVQERDEESCAATFV